jgi:trehalose-6-phosphate synthase
MSGSTSASPRPWRPLIEPDDLIWVHDYHLIPLARELRKLGVKNRIGFFLHIPWPAHQLVVTLPRHRQLVEAMFDYDLIGFQTEEYRCRPSRAMCCPRPAAPWSGS